MLGDMSLCAEEEWIMEASHTASLAKHAVCEGITLSYQSTRCCFRYSLSGKYKCL